MNPVTAEAAATPVSANGTSQAAADDFGADLYSQQPPSTDDEEARIQALQQGTAANWTQQVMQGGRGRGRGRGCGRIPYTGSGPPPPGYFCNKCGQAGHWRENCPNEGEYKRVRAPAGIPMTRLMENKEGGLYAPDGTLVSLKPNEDAFLREMAGLLSGADQAQHQAGSSEATLAAPEASAAAAAAIALPNPSTALVPVTAASGEAPEAQSDQPKPLLLDNKPHHQGSEPKLAGESAFATDLDFSMVPAATNSVSQPGNQLMNPMSQMPDFASDFAPQGCG